MRARIDVVDPLRPPGGARVRSIVTPEGVPLPFQVAPAGERLGAFAIDALVILFAMSLLGLTVAVASLALDLGTRVASVAVAVLYLAWFLIGGCYFAVFELMWAGQTPGKRTMRLRVIARDGGAVAGEALLARNLTRDIEIFVPLFAFVNPMLAAGGAPAWTGWLAAGWLFLIVLLPLFNRDRLRLGDFVGGTLVVREPREALLPDVAAPAAAAAQDATAAAAEHEAYSFSEDQLSSYGIYELQVLESVLQRAERHEPAVFEAIAGRIARRIGWTERIPVSEVEPFLRAFYRAQRGRLERRLLFGDRKERKSKGPS